MIRIAGVNLSPKKNLRFALTPIKGIGKSNVKSLLKAVYEIGISEKKMEKVSWDDFYKMKLGDVNEEMLVLFRNYIEENILIEADLRRRNQSDVKRLVDLKTWRGKRHRLNLPVRGQTTRTNSRTIRGNKRLTKSSGRAKSPTKT